MPKVLQIASYNLNGIRSAISKGLIQWICDTQYDIYLFQEIKADHSSIPYFWFDEIGYKHIWFPAEKKGYSGVAALIKEEYSASIRGMGIEKYDKEGRVLYFEIDDITIVNTYFPSGSSGDERQKVKMEFLQDYIPFIQSLLIEKQKVVVAGDFNICHQAIDIHDPVGNKNSSGFLLEEREWLSEFINIGFIDSFRYLHPEEKHHYSWWSYRAGARSKNKGWRIDYIMLSTSLSENLRSAKILPDVIHSDHCPVVTSIEI
jgi:exodeoxyribonuclease-3